MVIAVNTRVLLKSRMEGVCRYMHETLRRMVLNHPEDQFIFLFDRPYDESFVYASNVIPVKIGPPTRHPLLWYYWFEHQVPKMLKKYKVDVFLSPDTYNSLNTNIPSVIVTHDIAYEHFPEHIPNKTLKYYRKYFKAFHEKAAQVVAVSQTTKNDIVSTYGIEESKIDVAYNACPPGFGKIGEDLKARIRDKYSEGKPFFIYVGSIHPRKNVLRLLEAFDEFKKTNDTHKLIIIGRKAWKTKSFDDHLNNTRNKKDIHVHHEINEALPNIMAAATALVYVSTFEGFGIPILEAMESGVPVITSNVSSMPEVAGDAAILVDPFDPKEIAEGMKQVLLPSVKDRLIPMGTERVKNFSWDQSAEVIYGSLEKAIK